MRPGIPAMILVLGTLLRFEPADAGIMCTWFGRCLYESPGFQITVVDKETEQPLADVHALAEWVQNGYHGLNGPLMVQDAVSGPEGVLTFPAWGPIRGSPAGLVLNHDPVISLFKTGYKTMVITNAIPVGLEETERVRGFSLGFQSSALMPFRGTSEEWVMELGKAAYPPRLGGTSEDQITQFRIPYLNRWVRVQIEAEKLPKERRDVEHLVWSLGRSIKIYERGDK